jgi:hypothetical protein
LVDGQLRRGVSIVLVLPSFAKHMCVTKEAYCHRMKMGNFNVWVLEVFLASSLDIEQSLFKLSMKSNGVDTMAKFTNENPILHFLCTFSTSRVLSCFFPKYFKMAKNAMVQVFGSIKDERCFSPLTFYKYKLQN